MGWDLFNDVGVVRVKPADHAVQPVPLGDSAAVRVGEPVAAIGSPFGNQTSLAVGVVSATGRSIDSLTSRYSVADAIQIDAPINRGNSGGPLFDARGRVIGINAQIRSSSGTAEGVGFAIPINVARRALSQLEQTGKVSYAYLGITTQDVTPGMAKRFGIQSKRGAIVASVVPGAPAEKAGIQGGNQSESYNGLARDLRRRRDRQHRRRAGAELRGRVADRDRAVPARAVRPGRRPPQRHRAPLGARHAR